MYDTRLRMGIYQTRDTGAVSLEPLHDAEVPVGAEQLSHAPLRPTGGAGDLAADRGHLGRTRLPLVAARRAQESDEALDHTRTAPSSG
jgi:hypothetical protein